MPYEIGYIKQVLLILGIGRQAVDHAQLSHCPVAGKVTKHLWQVAAEAGAAWGREGLLLETFCRAGLGGASLVALPSRSRAASARLRFLDIGELLATALPSGGRPSLLSSARTSFTSRLSAMHASQ